MMRLQQVMTCRNIILFCQVKRTSLLSQRDLMKERRQKQVTWPTIIHSFFAKRTLYYKTFVIYDKSTDFVAS
jgi:hypothetical protein